MTKQATKIKIQDKEATKRINRIFCVLNTIVSVIFLASIVFGLKLVLDAEGPLDKSLTEAEPQAEQVKTTTTKTATRAKNPRTRTTAAKNNARTRTANTTSQDNAFYTQNNFPAYSDPNFNAGFGGNQFDGGQFGGMGGFGGNQFGGQFGGMGGFGGANFGGPFAAAAPGFDTGMSFGANFGG